MSAPCVIASGSRVYVFFRRADGVETMLVLRADGAARLALDLADAAERAMTFYPVGEPEVLA